ncbi:MAG: hypothetical protein M3R15_02715 [Acidobacteriota bacterium]|nr:hypothetical protein [Acidobacteriota bacterium]
MKNVYLLRRINQTKETKRSGVRLSQQRLCVGCLSFRIGKAVRVIGPRADVPDSPFVAFDTGVGIRGYTANKFTYKIEGPNLESLRLNTTIPVIGAGSAGNFDECGAWLIGVDKQGARIHGWYHAEEKCNYSIEQTHKSVAYAYSEDWGLTFIKPNYPNNNVLSAAENSVQGRTTGQGDQTVIKFGKYYLMYFLDNETYRTGVARSPISNCGLPGSWSKWHKGLFTEPGIRGKFTPLGLLGTSSSLYRDPSSNQAYVALIGVDKWFGGFKMSLSSDGINFEQVQDPLLYVPQEEWVRDSNKGELLIYPSVVAPDANSSWRNSFYLFYTYLQPGEDFSNRYLIRRKVEVSSPGKLTSPQVKVELSSYYSTRRGRHWVTTTMVPDEYTFEKRVGYVFTSFKRGMQELQECYRPARDQHVVGISCSGIQNSKKLRTLGWIWAEQRAGTVPLYSCYKDSTEDHFVSALHKCENYQARTEFTLGYVLSQ